LPVSRVAHLFSEVATAVAHAHSQGVIHRDLKPSNIMVTPHDHAKVLDLGLAFTEGEEVEDKEVVGGRGYIVGSIDYMPPEQTRDPTSVDNRADLYAIGCCMYYSLTGQPPFTFGTVYDKVKAHRHEAPQSVRATNRDVPEAFADIVHKLMAKRPEDRFGSAIELAYALESWRPHDALPLDTHEDEEFQRAVKDVVDGWVPLEPSKEAAQAAEDAVLFHVEVVDEPSADEPVARSIFREVDRVPAYVWLFVIVGAWLALLSLCVVGSCLFAILK
jgi:eukaryotic-like serine/threonine-protein kinase